jgi:hypothetical protein
LNQGAAIAVDLFVARRKESKQCQWREIEVCGKWIRKDYVYALLSLFDIYRKKLYLFDTKSNV